MLGRLKSLFFAPTVNPAKYKAHMSSSMSPCPTLLISPLLSHPPITLAATGSQIATFAAGCFWGVEHIFLKQFPPSQGKGILSTAVGYTGGNPLVKNPDYKTVCTGATDHAEAVKIEFDPGVVSYEELVGESSSVHYPIWPLSRVISA